MCREDIAVILPASRDGSHRFAHNNRRDLCIRIILAVLACALLTPANVSTQSSPLDAAAKTHGHRKLALPAIHRNRTVVRPRPAAHGCRTVAAQTDQELPGLRGLRQQQHAPRAGASTMPTPQPRGGGAPFAGEQRQVQFVRGAFAWNETPPAAGAQTPGVQPQPAAAAERLLWMWAASPQGPIKAAAGNARVRDGAERGGTDLHRRGPLSGRRAHQQDEPGRARDRSAFPTTYSVTCKLSPPTRAIATSAAFSSRRASSRRRVDIRRSTSLSPRFNRTSSLTSPCRTRSGIRRLPRR